MNGFNGLLWAEDGAVTRSTIKPGSMPDGCYLLYAGDYACGFTRYEHGVMTAWQVRPAYPIPDGLYTLTARPR